MEVVELAKPIMVQSGADADYYTKESNEVGMQIQNYLNDSWYIYSTHTMTVGGVGYLVYVLYKE